MDDRPDMPRLDRRRFIGAAAAVTAALATGRVILSEDLAFASVTTGAGPYGPLNPANDGGLQLPAGFTSRVVAVSGATVPNSTYVWHGAPDGGACFALPGAGWVYASNSELATQNGGAGVLRFDDSGAITDAYRILSNTNRNCAGGPTPWGTWLSCEENGSTGKVYECNPFERGEGVVRAAMGSFNHESASVDPLTGHVYLTEDDSSGRLYRFRPTTPGDLSSGGLDAAQVSGTAVRWVPTSASGPDRQSTTTPFNRAEGSWISGRSLFFTTTGNNRVYELALDTQQLTVLYDAANTPNTPLTGVDNITVHPGSADMFVAEDAGNMELCIIALVNGVRQVAPFLRIVGQTGSEITGPAFSPDGSRLYLSSQRGGSGSGITYEITGPFRVVPQSSVVVSRVSPSLGPGASWREIYVDGSGFNTGTTTAIGQGVTVHQTVVTSANRLTLKVSVAESASVGTRTTIVAASGGVVGSCDGCFQVLPPPLVTSVSPSVWEPGTTSEVRISGRFTSWGVSVGVAGTGVVVSGVRATTSLIVATVSVASNATTGERLLTVRNGDQGITRVPVTIGAVAPAIPGPPEQVVASPGDGQASVQFTASTLGGRPDSYTVRTVDPSGQIGAQVATGTSSPIVVRNLLNGQQYAFTVTAVNAAGESPPSAQSNSVTPVAQPPTSITISGVNPGLGPGASNREVYVNGAGFVSGSRVTIGNGVNVKAIRALTSTRITLAVSIAESTTPGQRDVTVVTPTGASATLINGFTVTPPPVITAVSASTWTRGTTRTIEISGSNFSSWGLAVGVTGTGISVSGVTRVSATLVRATIAVSELASVGTRDLTVRNGDQGLARTPVLVA